MPRPCASDQLLLRMLSLAVPAGSVNTVLTEQRFIAGYGDKNIAEVQELYMDKVRKRRVGIERVVELCGGCAWIHRTRVKLLFCVALRC